MTTTPRVLFETKSGSHLYGTNTPSSDLDLKYIVLPPLSDLLIAKQVKNKVVVTNPNGSNTSDDIDKEYLPLQQFAKDFVNGQTYALEIAFAIEGTHAGQQMFDPRGATTHDPLTGWKVIVRDRQFEEWDSYTPYLIDFINELKTRFLTSDIKAMVGYAVNQANLYSNKGARLNAAAAVVAVLRRYIVDHDTEKLGVAIRLNPEMQRDLEKVAADFPRYVQMTEYPAANNVMAPCLKVLNRILPHANSFAFALNTISTIVGKYGKRAQDAAASSEIDWKAMAHADRIVSEAIELLNTKQIILPRSTDQVQRFLDIRKGLFDATELAEHIDANVAELEKLVETTELPKQTPELWAEFDQFLFKWMKKFYGLT